MCKEKKMKNYGLRRVLAFVFAVVLVFGTAMVCGATPAQAAATTPGSLPSSTAPTTGTSLFNNRSYKESTITAVSSTGEYYYVTQDPAYEQKMIDSETHTVTYNGADYVCSIVYLENTGTYAPFTRATLGIGPNKTFFFEGGVYYNTEGVNYGDLSDVGLALVGLTDPKGANPVVLKKAEVAAGGMERYGINHSDMLYENLVFDGDGKTMYRDNNRGNFFIHVPSGDRSFHMKNCVLRNVARTSSLVATSAINIVAGNTAQVNFDGVSISGVDVSASYGTVQIGASSNVNIRNLNVTPVVATNIPVRVEYNSGSLSTIAAITTADVVFAGTISIGGNNPYILVQNSSHTNITVPADYRYALFPSGNPSNTTSANSSIRVYKTMPTVATNQAVYDIQEGVWVVRHGQSVTVQNQLAYINTVLTKLAKPVPTSATDRLSGGRAMTTDAYIKLVANASGELETLTVPAFAAAAGKVHISVVPTVGAAFGTAGSVPLALGAGVHLSDAATAGKVAVYGVDFHAKNNYTLHEVLANEVDGTATTISTNVTATSFVQCRFTGLVETLGATNVPANKIVDMKLGESKDFTAQLLSVYSHASLRGAPSATLTADDGSVVWRVVSVTPAGSVVINTTISGQTMTAKAVGVGTVVVRVEAVDAYNQGEITVPYYEFTIVVTAPTPPPQSDAASSSSSTSRVVSSSSVPTSGEIEVDGSTSQTAPTASVTPGSSEAPVSVPTSGTGTIDAQLEAQTGNVLTDILSGNVPLVGLGRDVWSLLNLILSVVALVMAVVLIVRGFGKRRKVREEEVEYADENAEEKRENRWSLIRLLAVVSGILPGVLFLILENTRLPMVFINRNTPVIALVFLIFAALTIVQTMYEHNRENRDDERQRDEEIYS